jgi:dihydropteroate synthase
LPVARWRGVADEPFLLIDQPETWPKIMLPEIMGILNVTPDSFSDGGLYVNPERAISHARAMIAAGADIIDVGGESTRPGAQPVSVQQEMDRVLPVIEALAKDGIALSIDTRKAAVMRAAVAAGAGMINDVSALAFDEENLAAAAAVSARIVLMHAQGTPVHMQDNPHYHNVVNEVRDYLAARVQVATSAGIARERLILDPGIGFGKTVEHNLLLLRELDSFHTLGCPLLIGLSRKSFIGRLGGGADAAHRLAGSLAGALWAAAKGVAFLRVHDVQETAQALTIWAAIAGKSISSPANAC